jgi:hypothetical protein
MQTVDATAVEPRHWPIAHQLMLYLELPSVAGSRTR